jgi:hypothetical protein
VRVAGVEAVVGLALAPVDLVVEQLDHAPVGQVEQRGLDRDSRIADGCREVGSVEPAAEARLRPQERLPERKRGVQIRDRDARMVNASDNRRSSVSRQANLR